MGSVVQSSYFCSKTQVACLSKSSISKVYCTSLYGRKSTSRVMSFAIMFSKARGSFSVRGSGSLACDLRSRFESCDAILVKLGANRLKTLQSPRNDLHSVTVLDTYSFWLATAGWFASFSSPGLIT